MRIQGDAGSLRCNHAESLDHAILLTVGREARFAGMKGHRLEAGQLSVAGPNPIRQRMGHETLEGPRTVNGSLGDESEMGLRPTSWPH